MRFRPLVRSAACALINVAVFLVMHSVVRPFVHNIAQSLLSNWRGEYALDMAAIAVVSVSGGALCALWSRHWALVALPAFALWVVGIPLLGLAALRSQGHDIHDIWSAFWPDRILLGAAALAALGATAGYGLVWRRRSGGHASAEREESRRRPTMR